MRKSLIAVGMAGLVLAATSSTASAEWGHRHYYYHRGPGPVLGLVGGLVVGAATVATLPFAILGAATRPAEPPPPPAYYGPPPPPAYAPPPPRGYPGYYYGPPPGYYSGY